jgi:BMFP domain-containing protein YqiC
MGRLADLFEHHRDNVEEGVKKALGRADDTLEALRKRVDELEAKLRDVAGEAPAQSQDSNVVTSEQAGNSTESVAASADKSARQTRSKKQ